MSRYPVPLYPEHPAGPIQGNLIGSLMMGETAFDIIRPGYDAQGRRRPSWTQFVHDGVPIYEVKVQTPLPEAIRKFEQLWDRNIDAGILPKALAAVRRERIEKYKDGFSGESPAPALTKDGRQTGIQYPS